MSSLVKTFRGFFFAQRARARSEFFSTTHRATSFSNPNRIKYDNVVFIKVGARGKIGNK